MGQTTPVSIPAQRSSDSKENISGASASTSDYLRYLATVGWAFLANVLGGPPLGVAVFILFSLVTIPIVYRAWQGKDARTLKLARYSFTGIAWGNLAGSFLLFWTLPYWSNISAHFLLAGAVVGFYLPLLIARVISHRLTRLSES